MSLKNDPHNGSEEDLGSDDDLVVDPMKMHELVTASKTRADDGKKVVVFQPRPPGSTPATSHPTSKQSSRPQKRPVVPGKRGGRLPHPTGLGATLQLERGVHLEVTQADQTLKIAEQLFVDLVVTQRHESLPSPLRTAVSCLLLEQICAVYSRYHGVLGTIAETVMRSVFVPNTAETRELLVSLEQPLRIPSQVSDDCVNMLQPYARKTYFTAYEQMSTALRRYARSNRAVEIRLSRQTKVFESTMKHWMHSMCKNFFAAWRNYTRRRHTLRAKYRAIFSRLRSDECKLRAVRRWRERSAKIKKAAMIDASSADELNQLKLSTAQMQDQINTLSDHNDMLSKQIADQESERQKLQDDIGEREKFVAELQQRTSEVERLGTEMLDSVLVRYEPPAGDTPLHVLVNWAHEVIEDCGGTLDGTVDPLSPLLSDEHLVEVPWASLGIVLMAFRSDRAPPRENVVQMHLSPDSAPTLLLQAYTQLTGKPSLVSEEQLRSRQRGIVLLFLASCMRYASNWLQCAPPQPNAAKAKAKYSKADGSKAWPDRIKMQQLWITTSLSAQNAALEVATKQQTVLSAEEQEDQVQFLGLTSAMFEDLVPSSDLERQVGLIMRALHYCYPDMRRLYITYACPVLTVGDFWRMLKDAKLVGGREKVSKKAIETICRYVFRHAWDKSYEDGINHVEVIRIHFTQMLLHFALAYQRNLQRNERIDLTPDHVTELITCLTTNALRADVDKFKHIVRHPHVQFVISQHKIPLRRAFRKYANCEEGETMNRVAFQQMARDCSWISKAVTMDAVNDVFRRVQNVEAGSVETLDLSEWLECVCALAVYHNPNPFSPLATKLGPFIEEKILHVLYL